MKADLLQLLTRIADSTYGALIPDICPGCHSNTIPPFLPICRDCLAEIKIICNRGVMQKQEFIDKFTPLPRELFFDQIVIPWYYNKKGRALLHNAKFHKNRTALKFLTQETAYILNTISNPLLSERNLLTRAPSENLFLNRFLWLLNTRFNIPSTELFTKIKEKHSKNLPEPERYFVVDSSIVLKKDVKIKCEPAQVIIIDDLWTTGATMNRLCRLVKEELFPGARITALPLFYRERDHFN